MEEFLKSLDWMTLISALWTVIMVPIGKQIYEWSKQKKIDKYVDILERNIVTAVKDVYQTEVKNVKHSSEWTTEKQNQVKELAKTKAIQALSASAYECLKVAIQDLDGYMGSLVEASLYDMKNSATTATE